MIDDMTRNIFKQYLLATNADPDRVYETLEHAKYEITDEEKVKYIKITKSVEKSISYKLN